MNDGWSHTYRIVMQRINAVVQYTILKPLPLHGKGIPIQPQDMVRVNLANGRLEPLVEGRQAEMLGVARLVDRIVACHPGVGLVASGDLLPEPDGSIWDRWTGVSWLKWSRGWWPRLRERVRRRAWLCEERRGKGEGAGVSLPWWSL
jgi:hypothetical protein